MLFYKKITAIAASKGIDSIIVRSDAIPIENEIGAPINRSTKKLEQSTMIFDHSIFILLDELMLVNVLSLCCECYQQYPLKDKAT